MWKIVLCLSVSAMSLLLAAKAEPKKGKTISCEVHKVVSTMDSVNIYLNRCVKLVKGKVQGKDDTRMLGLDSFQEGDEKQAVIRNLNVIHAIKTTAEMGKLFGKRVEFSVRGPKNHVLAAALE